MRGFSLSTFGRDDDFTLALTGRFDFNAHKAFRSGYESGLTSPASRVLTIDLTRVDYIDSSALGMLLLLRERAEQAGKSVVLQGASGIVAQVLGVANFGRLFTVA